MEKTLDYGIANYAATNHYEANTIGRITAAFGKNYSMAKATGEIQNAVLTGKLKINAQKEVIKLAVGDFVRYEVRADRLLVTEVLPRLNEIAKAASVSRKDQHAKTQQQIMAANVDQVFIVIACDQRFVISMLERYLLTFSTAKNEVVVILSKADYAEQFQLIKATIVHDYPQITVVGCTSQDAQMVEPIVQFLSPVTTSVFIGNSGAGKSTIVNAIAGVDLQKNGVVRSGDNRGKHTTSTTRLISLNPQAGYLIDTPGIKTIGIWETGDTDIFADIATIATKCRFRNCQHRAEPGCAIKQAIANGELTHARVERYLALINETGEHHHGRRR